MAGELFFHQKRLVSPGAPLEPSQTSTAATRLVVGAGPENKPQGPG